MDSISKQSIDDENMVARYLADQLTDEEREHFEAYYLEHPELLKELNRTALFKVGLHDLRASGVLQSPLTARVPWWKRRIPHSIAASMIVAIVIGFIWTASQRTSNAVLASSAAGFTHRFQATLTVAESRSIQRTRSSSYDATIQLPRERAAIELRIRPEVTGNATPYRVEIAAFETNDFAGSAIISGLQAAADGFIPVYLDSSKFPPGVYEVTIADESAGKTSAFLVELTAPQSN